MKLDREDIDAIADALFIRLQHAGVTYAGIPLAKPSSFQQEARREALEHHRQLLEKRAKREMKSKGGGKP